MRDNEDNCNHLNQANHTNHSSDSWPQYEMKDHLGNVRVTYSDRKIYNGGVYPNVSSLTADVRSVSNYYPFGMLQVGRNDGDYRFRFNGFEQDNEIGGKGSWMSFNDNGLDVRLCRRANLDPADNEFPNQSPYLLFNNNPLVYNDPSGNSGEVTINKQTKTITVSAKMILYGNAANAGLAASTAADVQNLYNAAHATVMIGKEVYKVQFEITGTYMPDLTAKQVISNTDIKNNYIRVESSGLDISRTKSNGGNSGMYLLSNIINDGSTTEAHEMGHGFGLWPGTDKLGNHPVNLDLRGLGQPGIMYPRGTLVDAEFTYDPSQGASKGTFGQPSTYKNTMDTEKRKVTQDDINLLKLDQLTFDSNGKAQLGKMDNYFYRKPNKNTEVSPTGPRKPDGSF